MRILIIKLSALGDIVHALPALHVLKDAAPELEIDWCCYKGFASLLSEQKAISELVILEDKGVGTLLKTIQKLRTKHYDLVIDMQGLIKTATLAKLAGASVLGFAQPREAAAALLYDHTVDTGIWNSNQNHVVDNNIQLVRYALEKILEREVPAETRIKYGIMPGEFKPAAAHKLQIKELCILPATTWESKLWPNEYWVELAQRMHHKYKCNIHILCTASDNPVVQPLLAQLKENCVPVVLHQDFKLKQLPSFFRSMDLIVGVDTGPLHIAAATVDPASTRIMGIYGPTSAKRTGPYGFASVSAEDLFGHIPMNKRKVNDDASMRTVLPELVLPRLGDSSAVIL